VILMENDRGRGRGGVNFKIVTCVLLETL